MNNTPTPRTDDQSVRYYDDATGTRIEYVAARFARQIERELTQRERERDSLEDQRDFARNLICILERERDEALERADTMFAKHVDILDQARRERDEAREGWADEIRKGQAGLRNAEQLYNEAIRERDDAQNEILGWKNKWDCAIEMGARAENALDEMTLRWERTNDALFEERAERKRVDEYATDLCCTLRCELDEERALADRLASTLKRWSNNDQASRDLAAWKEARNV